MICLIEAVNRINILHWSSIKCKRIIWNVLTFKLYDMNHEFDMKAMLKAILKKMLQFNISLMIYIDFKFLYKCFVKLKIIYKKRLMINVINRQSYEKREIIKIWWIDKNNNSVDFMTKIKISLILKILIDNNQINLNAIQWIERLNKNQMSKNKKNWINKKTI